MQFGNEQQSLNWYTDVTVITFEEIIPNIVVSFFLKKPQSHRMFHSNIIHKLGV